MHRKKNSFTIRGSFVHVDVSSRRLPNVEAIIDKKNLSIITDSSRRWTATRTKQSTSYVVRKMGGGNEEQYTELLHRIIMRVTDKKLDVDHANRNPLDNREINLRIATKKQNALNKMKRMSTSSTYYGVSWCTRDACWRAHCIVKGKRKALGTFKSELAAAKAYDRAVDDNEFYNKNF